MLLRLPHRETSSCESSHTARRYISVDFFGGTEQIKLLISNSRSDTSNPERSRMPCAKPGRGGIRREISGLSRYN